MRNQRLALLLSCAMSVLMLPGAVAFAAKAPTDSSASPASAAQVGEAVVTAQRRSEILQNVPIAVSAFSQSELDAKGVTGGQDLVLQVPNVDFTRTNFGSYNLSIRGVGTNTIGGGAQPGVSINENELPVLDNHFQDSDFYDTTRVEVARGPQGTLYGANATGGAVDIITNKPTDTFGGWVTLGAGDFGTFKESGAINVPLGDAFALRVAGMKLNSGGFGENTYLDKSVDGRDLGSIRATLSFKPNDRFNAYLMYENYAESDDRNRVGKQLCIKDPGLSSIGGVAISPLPGNFYSDYTASTNQGCLPGSLYQPAAYGTVDSNATFLAAGNVVGLNDGHDVFANNPLQDRNLHDIQSAEQPIYFAQENLLELHMEYNLTDHLTVTSITGYNGNFAHTSEDYNRIVPTSSFADGGFSLPRFAYFNSHSWPGNIVDDPQVGNSDLFRTYDATTTDTREYSEELRLASSFAGPFNFLAGASYNVQDSPFGSSNYYVMSNALTAAMQALDDCGFLGCFLGGKGYIDPNKTPNGSGHNYYDSRGGGGYVRTVSGFGEIYYNLKPDLKLTLGARVTYDQLYNIAFPIEVAQAGKGFPTAYCTPAQLKGGEEVMNGSEPGCLAQQYLSTLATTGRANLEWTPTLSFTNKTMFYASYSRGFKGGGFNTPCSTGGLGGASGGSCGYPPDFAPEYINAFEVGTKNTLAGGRLVLDADAFYYDYQGYQISEIVDNSSVNLNINAKIYGIEFEGIYSPIHNLTLNANIGFLHSAIDNGVSEVDEMNLTQGNPNYTLLHNDAGEACLAPTSLVAEDIQAGYSAPFIANGNALLAVPAACGVSGGDIPAPFNPAYPNYNPTYQFGVPENLSGKQLPDTPEFTVSLGAQYVWNLPHDWTATLHGDYYWQADSWARIFNAVNDKLLAYDVVNATLTLASTSDQLELQGYVKNMFNAQPITGVYLSSDTSGLFQNVFTLDPRTFGVRLTKRF